MTLPADNMAFHALHPSGGEGYVVLLFRPRGGRVTFREWSSADYAAPGREASAPVEVFEARVRGWAREGWALTEAPDRIAAWLRSA